MKLYNLKIKQIIHALAGIAIIVSVSITINSCKKPGITSEVFDASNLRVVNGLPDRSVVKFYLDTSNLTLTGTINFSQVSPIYYVVKSGLRKAKFYSTVTQDTFAMDNIQLDPNKDYTLFLAGDAIAPKFWLTEDDLTSPPADKVKIRFANLALTSVNIDVTIQSQDTSLPQPKPEVKVLSNIAPQSISSYTLATVPVSKGNALIQLHTIRVYEAGTNNLLITLTGADLRGTDIRTFILTGINGGTPALSLSSAREWLDW